MTHPLNPPRNAWGPVVYRRQVGSTMDLAHELAMQGSPDGTVVACDSQTAGRGRQGRAWQAPAGKALAFTLVISPLFDGFEFLPFAAALAVCEAAETGAGVACQIKWPNDVYSEDRKLAGILIESRPREGWAAVGIGVNANLAPDDLPPELRDSATSVSLAAGHPVDRSSLLDATLGSFGSWIERLRSGGREILAAFARRDALLGRQIHWDQAGHPHTGIAAGIDAEGNLMIDQAGERCSLRSGEVHLGPTPRS